ncbi:MAG: disulfide bond formation protein B [Oxalobacter sp.]|nr:MAG: disulfide bond formation protein B [Oxalobacter sp.]
MKKNLLYLIALAGMAVLGYAMHLQYFNGIKTCQLCVVQRYALTLLVVTSIVCAFFNAPRTGAVSALFLSLCGAGTAGWQVWHISKRSVACAFNSLDGILNHLITAKVFPAMFHVDVACVNERFRILMFSIPEWSLLIFGAISALCLMILFVRVR